MLTSELAKGPHDNYVEFEDRAEGIRHAIEVAEPGDTVVLASKEENLIKLCRTC